jgi:hypothetical protein
MGMERTTWTDERIDDAFGQLCDEMRAGFADIRAEMRAGFAQAREEDRAIRTELFQLKLFMLGGLVTILAAVIALHG